MHKIVATLLDSKYKHIIGYAAAIIVCSLVTWYTCATIKSSYWQKVASGKAEQVNLLKTKVYSADVEFARLNGELVSANKQTAEATEKAKIIQKKVDQLIATYDTASQPTSTTTQFTQLEECNKQVEVMQADIKTFVEEVKTDRQLIRSLETEKGLLISKSEKLTESNSALSAISIEQSEIITVKDGQIAAEQTKTKIWKRVTYGAGVVIIILLL